MSISVYEYIRNSACIGTSLDSYFFLSHSICINVLPSVGYTIAHCRCIGTYLDPRFSISLFLSLSVSVSGYIIGNLRVCEQVQSARPACNNAIENSFIPF